MQEWAPGSPLPLGSTKVLASYAVFMVIASMAGMLRAWVSHYAASGGACTEVAGSVRGVSQVPGGYQGQWQARAEPRGEGVHIRGGPKVHIWAIMSHK